MARVVGGAVGFPPRVRWEQWADGQTWELRQGEDFDQDPERARRAAIAWAGRHGMTAHTSVRAPDRLRVQFLASR